jgi:hypothetical protein
VQAVGHLQEERQRERPDGVLGYRQALFCYICDKNGHVLRTCEEPKVKCDECGIKQLASRTT